MGSTNPPNSDVKADSIVSHATNKKSHKRRALTSRMNVLNAWLDEPSRHGAAAIQEAMVDTEKLFAEFEEAEEQYVTITGNENDGYVRYVEEFFEIKSRFRTVTELLESEKQEKSRSTIDREVTRLTGSGEPPDPLDEPSDVVNQDTENNSRKQSGLGSASPVENENVQTPSRLSRYPGNSVLPIIDLPKFSGSYAEWPSWRDTFLALIHNCSLISSIEKMHFLKTSLQGEPANLLSDLPATQHNYLIAWEKIVARYDRPQFVIESLIERFVRIPSCSGNPNGLRKTVDAVDNVIRCLARLGPEAESRDPWVVYLLKSKLDDETRKHWAQKSVQNPNATLTDLIKFLENRCYATEIYGQNKEPLIS